MAELVSIKAVRGLLGEPRKQYEWEMIIPDLPAPLLLFTPHLSLRARGASIPGIQNETFQTQWGPLVFNHAGKKSYPRRVTLRFEEGALRPVLPIFYYWNEIMWSEPQGRGSDEGNLLANMWIRLLKPDSDWTTNIHFYGAFPVITEDSPLAYESSGQVFLSVQFAYDYWRYELYPF